MLPLLFGVVLFYYFFTLMVCGSRQCQTKSNIAVQNVPNFTISVPLCTSLILRMTANSVHIGQFCAKFCVCRIAEF